MDKYRKIVQNLPLLICSFLPGGEISFVNQAYADYFNKSIDELVGSNFLSLIPEADRKTVMDNISALSQESPTQSHEHKVISATGAIRWQRWTNRAMVNTEGKVVEYQSIGEDISEHRQAEERLRESEELHRIVLSAISDAVFITDDTGAFTYICPNVSEIFGYSFKEAIALESIERLMGIQLFDRMDLDTSGEIKNIECVIHDKSGVEHILLVNVKLVSIKGGTTLFTCRDITDRKRAEKALLDSEERYRQLFNNESDAVMIFDAHNRRFEDANPATLNLFGYSKEEFLKLTVENISTEKTKTKAAVEKITYGDGSELFVPLRFFMKKNGMVFPGEIKAGTFIFNNRKKVIGAVRDITKRIQAEETIRKLSFNWLTAQEMERKRIASDLHDDLGQCLALLKLQIRNIQKNLLPKQDDLINECENLLKYTNQLIEKVRTLSHGLTPGMLDDIGLTASLKSLIKGFSKYAYIYIEKDIANIDKLFPPLSEITIYRIFQEILTNIEKHSEADFVKIVVAKDNDFVSFMIEDTGKGFDLERINVKYPNQGGLGLASIKERLQMLGGRIEIKSRLNKGTKIHFMIPFDQETVMSKTSFSSIEPALTP